MTVICMMTGCGGDETLASLSRNSIVIHEDHTVDTYISEDFDTSVYSDIELMDFLNKEVTEYTSLNPGSVTVGDTRLENNHISLNISYSSITACNDNMDGILFIGTVGDAFDNNVDMNVSLYVVGAGIKTVGKLDLKDMRDEKLIVVNGKYTIRAPGKIKYYSQWMDLLDDYTVQPLEDKGSSYYIIYE